MKIFVTGATGFVGSVTVKELIAAGHQVLGLSRSEESANALKAAGAEVHMGSLDDLESLKAGAAACDGVIHTAFIHDFTNYGKGVAADKAAIIALGEALAGSQKPLVVTSGTALVAGNGIATENSERPQGAAVPRVSEQSVLTAHENGVRISIVRLPPSVHGNNDHGFVPALINIAREKGEAAYVGDGSNRWPAVHKLDAAKVFRLAVEKGADNAVYHAVHDAGIPMREIAEMIGKHLNAPVVSKTKEEAAAHFGWLAHFVGIDNPASADITKETLGWKPTEIGLLEDMNTGDYFLSK